MQISELRSVIPRDFGQHTRAHGLGAVMTPAAHETVTVHEPDTPPVTLSGEDALEGRAVLPGFNCAAGRIFDS